MGQRVRVHHRVFWFECTIVIDPQDVIYQRCAPFDNRKYECLVGYTDGGYPVAIRMDRIIRTSVPEPLPVIQPEPEPMKYRRTDSSWNAYE